MATIAVSHRISVSSSVSASGRVWTVFVAGESRAIFTGERAKERALDAALWLAEDLRSNGTVQVVVDPADDLPNVAPVSRLAS